MSCTHLRLFKRVQCGALGREEYTALIGSRQRQMVGACVDEMGDAL